ncbi:DUF1315 family protein [Alteromonas sediminis]|uniref:DUF1315 family protein n=1 Tax=Alteromonas sediminis TaxID=2259342 RepID=A0A3N5Y3U8_9ALTE|nr:DUF1315 family protein [Alteromonas sediminis]RPJ68767.1 DUF1315 family protein [Alteromonas sediminis]
MNIDALLASMTPHTYNNLRQAVETGKWPDGRQLDDNQKAVCLQAVMLYQAKVEKSEQHMTIGAEGEIVQKSKSELRSELKENETIARFKQDDF